MKLLKALSEMTSTGKLISMNALAEASRLHPRRVTVLINALEELELVERSGRALKPIGNLRPEQLDELFGDFDAQHRAERDRLQAMICYSESLECRMQLLREYFGEDRGHPCDHCDNCKRPPERVHDVEPAASIGTPTEAKSDFASGRRVRHRTFGEGEVIRAEDIRSSFSSRAGARSGFWRRSCG